MIPREQSPIIEVHVEETTYELDRDNTVVRMYSPEYEEMDNVVHTREAMGAKAVAAIILFNQPELTEILIENDFTMVWSKYPDDSVVDHFTQYQINSLDFDLDNS